MWPDSKNAYNSKRSFNFAFYSKICSLLGVDLSVRNAVILRVGFGVLLNVRYSTDLVIFVRKAHFFMSDYSILFW